MIYLLNEKSGLLRKLWNENNEIKRDKYDDTEEKESLEHCEASDYKYKYVYFTGKSDLYNKTLNQFDGVRNIII